MSDRAQSPIETPVVRSRGRRRASPSAEGPRKRARANKTTSTDEASTAGNLAEVARVLSDNKVRSSEATWFTQRINVATLPQGAQDQWANGPERLAFEDIDATSTSLSLLALWRVCAHLFRCSPVAIVSPQYGMYHISGHGPGQDLVMWSRRFCQKLSMLVTHPFWGESRVRLAFFIRFAAVYRTDRRRPLISMPSIQCPILSGLQQKTSMHNWEEDIHGLHIQLRNQAKREGSIVSLESNVLYRLGEVVSRQSRRQSTTDDDQKVWVNGTDLDAVIEALDSYNSRGGLRAFFPTKTLYKTYIDARESNGFPNPNELKTAHVTSWLRELRDLHSSRSDRPNYTGLETELERRPVEQDEPWYNEVQVSGVGEESIADSTDRHTPLSNRSPPASMSEQWSFEEAASPEPRQTPPQRLRSPTPHSTGGIEEEEGRNSPYQRDYSDDWVTDALEMRGMGYRTRRRYA